MFIRLQLVLFWTVYFNTVSTHFAQTDHVNSIDKQLSHVRSCWLLQLLYLPMLIQTFQKPSELTGNFQYLTTGQCYYIYMQIFGLSDSGLLWTNGFILLTKVCHSQFYLEGYLRVNIALLIFIRFQITQLAFVLRSNNSLYTTVTNGV